ncbi:hypothetical protein [Arthrobacter sp. UYEF20]|uniref:hypothetical protein n=1 Tax=Arthrobacter sp. UYEF20 TaxID=1756363 RepID=UPI0033997320
MRLLNRLLRGLPCSCSGRSGRRGNSGAPRAAGARNWRRKHSETCEECRLRERRERQYLERLRGAAVPAASDELTARLLGRTEELARGLPPAALRDTQVPSPVHGQLPDGAAYGGEAHGGALHGGARPAIRLAALTAGGAAAAVALMAGFAYLLGGHPVPVAAAETASAILQEDMRLSAAAAGTPGAGTDPGWNLTGEPDMTPSGALTAEQLTALRTQGWTFPELRELGFHLVWARGGEVAGEDVVELRLTDGRHFATVLEQHLALPSQRGVAGLQQPAASPPVNVLTGHTATADGFTAVSGQGTDLQAGAPPERHSPAGNGTLWINPAAPFRAIYQGSAGTFTYVSDQPAEQAGEGVAALVRMPAAPQRETPAAEETTPDGITARIERGLGRILGLLAT